MSNYPLWDQLNQLKESKWVDLTHTFDPDIPRFSDFEKGEVSSFSQFKNMVFMFNDGISSHNMVRISMPLFISLKIRDTLKN